ncbi:MAG TPA: branched-chain amino acid ABC transporter substrate-binding protein [Gammaproteobacteria bacterium]|nr:branched-chain amino acid ABC transporter substrate-binding protein [Gammaproteobacteria bacterium]
MSKLLRYLLASIGLLAIGTLTAQAANTVLIGVQVPITGPQATYGKDMLNAVKLAANYVDNHGGINGEKIKLTVGDSACDPQEAVNAASKLASKGVDAVVGGYCSGATLPTLKVYGDSDIPFVITASNSTKLIPANPGNAFMINSTGFAQVKKAVDFFQSQKVKSLAIVNRGDAYSQNLASLTRKQWEKLGKKVPVYATVNRGQQDFSSLVTKITNAHPDAVFWTAYYSQGALLIRQLRENGYTGLIALGDGSNSPKLFKIAGRAAEGVYCFSNPIVKFLPKAKHFIAEYKKQFNEDPGPYSALTYDGMRLIAWAMNKAHSTDHKKVVQALASANGPSWLTGPISFTKKNTLARSNFVVLKGKGGEWTLYKR